MPWLQLALQSRVWRHRGNDGIAEKFLSIPAEMDRTSDTRSACGRMKKTGKHIVMSGVDGGADGLSGDRDGRLEAREQGQRVGQRQDAVLLPAALLGFTGGEECSLGRRMMFDYAMMLATTASRLRVGTWGLLAPSLERASLCVSPLSRDFTETA